MTLAGLNTVNLSELNTFQQFLLFLLIMLGSAIFVSAFVVHVRQRAFDRKIVDLKERQSRLGRVKTWTGDRLRGRSRESRFTTRSGDAVSQADNDAEKRDETPPGRRGGPEMNGISSKTGERLERADTTSPERSRGPGISFRADTRFGPSTDAAPGSPQAMRRRHSNIFSMQGVGARPMSTLRTNSSLDLQTFPSLQRGGPDFQLQSARRDISRYIDTATGWISRNSQFHGLSEEERERLGGYEYRAVSLLAWLVPIYFVLWQLIGCIGCAAWVAINRPNVARSNGLDPWWVGAFNAVSA